MSEEDRQYYIKFAEEARKEYQKQIIEYRATGSYQPSQRFKPLENTNIWIRIDSPCALEQELQSYDTVQFRPRPPELDEAYEERQMISRLKRKLRIKGLIDNHGNLQEGVDFKKLLEEERRRQKRRKEEQQGLSSTKKPRKRKLDDEGDLDNSPRVATIAYESLKRSLSNAIADSEVDRADSDMEEEEPSKESESKTSNPSSKAATAPAARARMKLSASETVKNHVKPPQPVELHRGPPRNWPKEEGIDPDGWVEVIKQRYCGRRDKYWYSPGGNYFRTMKELKTFLNIFKDFNGDESAAYKVFKERRGHQHQNANRQAFAR
jgi:hypothetical protein